MVKAMSRPSACSHVGGPDRPEQALLEPVDDDPHVEPMQDPATRSRSSWRRARWRLGDAQFGDQQDEVGPRQQRQRPVGPVGRQVDEHRPELARRELDDLDASARWSRASSGIIVARRGDDLEPAGMRGRRRAQQFAVEPRAGLDQVGERQLRPQAELEGGVAELDVEVDQAGFAADASPRSAAKRIASWSSSAVAPTPPSLLITLTILPCAGVADCAACADAHPRIGASDGFQLGDVERQRHDVVRAGADQRADERQRRLIGGGDQRRLRGRCQLLEALDRRRLVADRPGRPRPRCRPGPPDRSGRSPDQR